MKSAVGIFSGGLDSWLSALLIKGQGFKVYLLHFSSPYFGYKGDKLEELRSKVQEYGMELLVQEPGDEYLQDVFCAPKYGYGSSKNPCIDCHAYMLAIAKQKMKELNAELVFSGEVLGQRPMSQRSRGLSIVEKESGLQGYLVRPLSAKLLKPSIPEQNNILQRDMLKAISGRGRKDQMVLAKELGLNDYPQPAGGCKFTDPNLAKRLSKILDLTKHVSWEDLKLLYFNRVFYVGDNVCVFVTRDEESLRLLSSSFKMGMVVEACGNVPGATGLAIKYNNDGHVEHPKLSNDTLNTLGRILARYTKAYQQGALKVEMCFMIEGELILKKHCEPFTDQDLGKYRL